MRITPPQITPGNWRIESDSDYAERLEAEKREASEAFAMACRDTVTV